MFGILVIRAREWVRSRIEVVRQFRTNFREAAANALNENKEEALEYIYENKEKALECMKSILEEIDAGAFSKVQAVVDEVSGVVQRVTDIVSTIEQTVTYLKEKYDYVNGLKEKYFAPKFDKKFPRKVCTTCSAAAGMDPAVTPLPAPCGSVCGPLLIALFPFRRERAGLYIRPRHRPAGGEVYAAL
jgi:hypothetical protein